MGYHRKFFQNYGKLVAPLIVLLKKNAFNGSPTTNHFLQALKATMCTTRALALLDFNKTFVLEYDASGKGIGVVLRKERKPLSFTSKQFFDKHLGKCTYEKEMFVILHEVNT